MFALKLTLPGVSASRAAHGFYWFFPLTTKLLLYPVKGGGASGDPLRTVEEHGEKCQFQFGLQRKISPH